MSGRSKMMSGTPILQADNTIPGIKIHKEVAAVLPQIEAACRKMGLDYYPIIVEFVSYDEMAELASYGGFPVRYPHWRFGMEYEEMSQGYEHNQYRISEMVINCLHPDTLVPTIKGTVKASQVKAGDDVFAGNGLRRVAKVERQEESRLLRLKLKGQQTNLRCTFNHKWMVVKETGPEWVKASAIKPGDILLGGDIYRHFFNMAAKVDWSPDKVLLETAASVRSRVKPLLPPIEMTLPLAELLGAVVGDGSQGVKSKENIVSVYVDKTDLSYQAHIDGLFRMSFQEDTLFEFKENITVISLCSKLAVDFFDYIGLSKGSTYKTKTIPWSIWASSSEYRAAFIRGLFDTDGYANDVLGFSCYNRELAANVQLLLAEMGIYSVVDHVNNDHNDIWKLTIQGRPSKRKFKDRIGFTIQHKADGLARLIDTLPCVGKGADVAYLRNKVIELADEYGINTYTERSLGSSVNLMKKTPVGMNAIERFLSRAVEAGYKQFLDLFLFAQNPMYVVEEVQEDGVSDTVDIALYHGDHDFMANGVMTHNTNPAYIYCMDSNTLVDNVDVIAHAIGHTDFFKNNIFFEPTDENMMNKLANHGTRVRNYMARWGHEVVTEFIDHCLRIETLIDPAKAWRKKKIKSAVIRDERNYEFAERLRSTHNYMDEWVNPKEYINKQNKEIKRQEASDFLDVFDGPLKDIFEYLKDHAPLKPWQQDIISMLYEESMYFSPQRATKMGNEGWASFTDHHILCEQGLAALGQESEDAGIWHYAEHKMRVLGGKYSQNPYKLGFELFLDIRDRWNKGQFGSEWENCKDMKKKENWDKKLGLGMDKIFEVRKHYNDFTMIQEFFTPEFCEKKKFFEYKRFPNGEYKIVNRDFKSIKKKLLQRYLNGGLPDIRLTDPNHLGKGWFFMQHQWDGRPLYDSYARETIISVFRLWKNIVVLATKNRDGLEYVFVCDGVNPEKNVHIMTREDYEKEFLK